MANDWAKAYDRPALALLRGRSSGQHAGWLIIGRPGRRVPGRAAGHAGLPDRSWDSDQLTGRGTDPAGLARYPLRQRGNGCPGLRQWTSGLGRGYWPSRAGRGLVPGVGWRVGPAADDRGQRHRQYRGQQDQR
jgi:hypothetical protein